MKIKSLLIGMLACTALVGCTDEVIENGTENNKQQTELTRGDAYVNFVINTATDSSRSTTGDNHDSADDNKHYVAGIRTENSINKLLVIIAKVTEESNENKYELYNPLTEEQYPNVETRNGYVGYFDLSSGLKQNNGTYTLNSPLRMDYTGKYAVLVVANPVTELKNAVDACKNNHKAAYEAVLNFHGNAYETIKNGENKDELSFQMSNKEVELVEAKAENNVPEKPATASIPVERTTAKTTWRWKVADESYPESLQVPNVWPIDVAVTQHTAVLGSFWYTNGFVTGSTSDYKYLYSEEFNKAKDSAGNTWWVLFKKGYTGAKYDNAGRVIKDAIEAIFKGQDKYELYTGVIDDTNNDDVDDDDDKQSTVGREIKDDIFNVDLNVAINNITDALVQKLTFETTTQSGEGQKYYVKLTHYALTNLSPSAYAVRHLTYNQSFAEKDVVKMGILGSKEYLVTPYSAAINNNSMNSFLQPVADVNKVSIALNEDNINTEKITIGNESIDNMFKVLPTEDTDGEDNGKLDGSDKHENAPKSVGYLMEYLNENSSLSEKQTPANITGVVFAGQIYDGEGNVLPVLYKYNQVYYRTLQALVDAQGTNGVLTIGNYKITPNSTDEQAAAAGIDVYREGRCFYYSTEIKHLDDGIEDNSETKNFGVMEFAIMRNNIYSLAINQISGIGDARLNITENTPISDIRSYVQLEVSILPWIVRFNDIDF